MTDIEVLTRDLQFYSSAAALAEFSDYSTRVGCIAAKGRKRIAGAVNTVRNQSNLVPYGEATYHAEKVVLQMVPNTDKVTLYIARLGKDGLFLPSRPCIRCMKAIDATDVSEIVYLDKYNKVVKEVLC